MEDYLLGISKAENEAELRAAIDLTLKYDGRILIGQGVVARGSWYPLVIRLLKRLIQVKWSKMWLL